MTNINSAQAPSDIVRGQSGNGTAGSFFAHVPASPEISDLSPTTHPDFDTTAGPVSTIDTIMAGDMNATDLRFWEDIADDDNAPAQILREMTRFAPTQILSVIAGSKNLDRDTRDHLAKHADEDIRAQIIYRNDSDAEFLAQFEDDDAYAVGYALSCQEKIDPDQLRRLSFSEWAPDYEIIRNPAAPDDVVERLFSEGDDLTAARVLRRPNAAAWFDRAAVHDSPRVRAELAGCRPLPAAISDTLSQDPHASVRLALASGYAIKDNMTVLGRLMHDEDPDVRKAALRHSSEF